MTDEIDRAARRADEWLADALRAQARRAEARGEGRAECEDCGEAIAPARRLALPGVRRCVECQALHERQGARGRA